MRKIIKKAVLGSAAIGAAIASFCAVSYSLTKRLVEVALDREEPKRPNISKTIVSGTPMDTELLEKIELFSEKLSNSGLETVEMTSRDGEHLVGHFFEAENAKRIIIAMHGWRSSWTRDFGAISDFWHKNGCSVLYAEQRGQNNSSGEYMGFGMLERYDCLDWINFVNDRFESKYPIYLAGISMGASTVLMASGLPLPDNVRGVISDCGYTSAHDIWKHVAENNLRMSYGLVGKIADDICRRKINVGTKECSTQEALSNSEVPVLFIHGSDDNFVPVSMTYENYKACRAPKKLLIVPGAGHCMSYITAKDDYEKAILDFWEKYD